MTDRLYKLSDEAQEWVPKLVLVPIQIDVPDPWIPPPVDPPDWGATPVVVIDPPDPADTSDPPRYGPLCQSDGSTLLGVIPDGYVQKTTIVPGTPTLNDPYPQALIVSCWGPP